MYSHLVYGMALSPQQMKSSISLFFFASVYAQNIPSMAWGFASSSYQVEGAWNVDGKGPSVWDKWFQDGNPLVRSPGVTAAAAGSPFNTTDHYRRMKSDIAIMKSLGTTIYRFSVSWPRILPNCNGQVNQAGLDFYSSMIDELLLAGIEPVLTMYHWDTPQACEDQYRSWSSDRIITDFTNYADILFQNYGERVKLWLTLNEPAAYCGRAFGPIYDQWIWPPAHNGTYQDKYDCIAKVSRAHGSVVNLARTKYSSMNMKFSMPLIIAYYIPVDTADIPGANELTQSQADWLWAPLVTGDYPSYLRSLVTVDLEGKYLPAFTADQQSSMRGTLDYLAINYYSASYYNGVSQRPKPTIPRQPDQVSWQDSYPQGIRDISKLLSSYYASMGMTSKNGKAEIMISECGYGSTSEAFATSIATRVNDVDREKFFSGITDALRDAVLIDNTPITSFIAWSLLDNLEWLTFDQVWGLVSVDQIGGTLNRTVKNSARSLSRFFEKSTNPYITTGSGSSLTGSSTKNSATSLSDGSAFIFSLLSYLMYVV